MKIDGTTFFVTGGGSGLGAACARHFTSLGGKVLIADVQEETSRKVADELGKKARFVRTDVTMRPASKTRWMWPRRSSVRYAW